MRETDTATQAGQEAVAAVAPEADIFAVLDPVDFGAAILATLWRAGRNPADASAALWHFASAVAQIGPDVLRRWSGLSGAAASQPPGTAADKRFTDPAWEGSPGFFALRQAYLASCRLAEELVTAGSHDPVADLKAQLATRFVLDAASPTNFLLTNPAALKRVFETGGVSMAAGTRNFLDDLRSNGGWPRQVDTSSFEVGGNLAATPGKIVFRNDLMELIQYAPQTAEVRAVPLLASPPWINKYYIMDLAPGRSFIEWAVTHGRTVFAISYRNPDARMRDVTLDDYLISGPSTALDVIADITGSAKIDLAGLCLGGALTGMLAAYLAATGDDRIGSVTVLNTLLDYSEPGVLGAFTDERTVTRLERQMERHGYLGEAQMGTTFDLLRPNDLIFNYVVANWLMGQRPPAFDILAWNADSTRLPARMHAFYLRSLYLHNELALGRMELAGQQLLLSEVKSDAYVVGAVNDHIVPWEASYKATSLLGGDVRYVLSSGGHVAGIVNPPSPKSWYEVAPHNHPAPAEWREHAKRHSGSWWQDWVRWADKRAGPQGPPPAMGNDRYPALADAPGDYVRR
jgi:polyhydroxyalkanoate synthase